jgi:hypothetical protein
LVDEPIVNRHFATLADLEAVIAERCRRLDAEAIKPHTDFHWWPKPIRPNRSAGDGMTLIFSQTAPTHTNSWRVLHALPLPIALRLSKCLIVKGRMQNIY